MIKNKDSRLLDEVCSVGKLEDYRETLRYIFLLINESGCKVSTRYDVGYSNINDSVENGSHIRISLVAVQYPLDIIWKLLHEYGHFLSGKRQPTDSTIYREELAWKYADELLERYPELVIHKDAYERCKEECLISYRRKFSHE